MIPVQSLEVLHTFVSHDMSVILQLLYIHLISWRDVQVTKLIIWVEAMFTDYFTGGDRHHARKALRPAQTKRPLRITFFLGKDLHRTENIFVGTGTGAQASN